MYKIIFRPLLFLFAPETIHHFVGTVLTSWLGCKPLLRWFFVYQNQSLEKKLFGLRFINPVGLAAGFDKNGTMIDEMACLGFGFIELGTVTPRGQEGNPKPRLFRLSRDKALINRMGFNNVGAEQIAMRLKKKQISRRGNPQVLIGGNIGKNKSTPNEEALADYEFCFHALYPYVDYFVINVSSPNTPGLRLLQNKKPLGELLIHIKKLSQSKEKVKPVLLKIAPDLTLEQMQDIVHIVNETAIDGIVATNTTVDRHDLLEPSGRLEKIGHGGLSGVPLRNRANRVIAYMRQHLGSSFPIIGVGGIASPEDAIATMEAGADLIQLYTGLIYEGPGLVKRINKAISQKNNC